MSSFIPIPDPFPSKGPILGDKSRFYEREELFVNIYNSLRAGDSVSLVGERKAGKTSFLNYLLAHLPANEFIPVFIDTQKVAPKTDKMFLGRLMRDAARAITKAFDLDEPLQTNTLSVEPELAYLTFEVDLELLRNILDYKVRLVWLIDEIEILREYKHTELYSFLRSYAQSDPDFRFVVAGYDVLYTLSNQSDWSPFFNAFNHIRLEGLNPIVAKQLVDDALETMGATLEESLYRPLIQWTGQKPYYLKWILSNTAEALNLRQTTLHIDQSIVQAAQTLFLQTYELKQHFAHLWQSHTTARQQTLLSLIATQPGPYNHLTILDDLRQKQLIQGNKQASRHLIEDLTRLEQLGFLYERIGEYTFTSECLKLWIKENKPLG